MPAPQVVVELGPPERPERRPRDLQRHGLVRRRRDVRGGRLAPQRAARGVLRQRHLGARRVGQEPVLAEGLAGFQDGTNAVGGDPHDLAL